MDTWTLSFMHFKLYKTGFPLKAADLQLIVTIPSDLGPQKPLPHTPNWMPKAIKTELRAPPVMLKSCQGLVPHPLLSKSIPTADWLVIWRLPTRLNTIGCMRGGQPIHRETLGCRDAATMAALS